MDTGIISCQPVGSDGVYTASENTLSKNDCCNDPQDQYQEENVRYMTDLSSDADPEAYTADTVIISENTTFGEVQLPNGQYAMLFEMYDATGASALSDVVLFDCADGEIATTVF